MTYEVSQAERLSQGRRIRVPARLRQRSSGSRTSLIKMSEIGQRCPQIRQYRGKRIDVQFCVEGLLPGIVERETLLQADAGCCKLGEPHVGRGAGTKACDTRGDVAPDLAQPLQLFRELLRRLRLTSHYVIRILAI